MRARTRPLAVVVGLALGMAVAILAIGWLATRGERTRALELDRAALPDDGADRLVRPSQRAGADRTVERTAAAADAVSKDSAAAPDLPVGSGWIRGVVVGLDGGVGGARVRIGGRAGGAWRTLGEVSTASDGTFELLSPEIAALAPFARDATEIEARARAPGRIPAVDWRVVDPRTGGAEGLTLLLRAGAVLSGRAVDARGMPVCGASVKLGPGGPHTESGDDGRFELPLFRVSPNVLTLASARHGIWSRTLALSTPLEDLELGDCALDPAGRLAGRVRTQDGGAAARVAIAIAACPPDRSPFDRVGELDAAADFDPRSPVYAFTDLGPVHAFTDDDGRFEILGLRAARWRFLGPIESPELCWSREREDVEVTLWGTYLRVRVVDAGGNPVPGVEVLLRAPWQPMQSDERGSDSEASAVAQGEHAEAWFPVAPRSRCSITVRALASQPCESWIEGGAEGSITEARLVLLPLELSAAVRVELPPELAALCIGFRADLVSVHSGAVLQSFQSFECDADGFSPLLGPGEYVLQVHPRGPEKQAIEYWRQRPALPRITLTSGERTTVSVPCEREGRLALQARDPAEPPRLTAIELLPQGASEPFPVAWSTSSERDALERLAAGRTVESSETLQPGAWSLRLVDARGDAREMRFEIRAGETTLLLIP